MFCSATRQHSTHVDMWTDDLGRWIVKCVTGMGTGLAKGKCVDGNHKIKRVWTLHVCWDNSNWYHLPWLTATVFGATVETRWHFGFCSLPTPPHFALIVRNYLRHVSWEMDWPCIAKSLGSPFARFDPNGLFRLGLYQGQGVPDENQWSWTIEKPHFCRCGTDNARYVRKGVSGNRGTMGHVLRYAGSSRWNVLRLCSKRLNVCSCCL